MCVLPSVILLMAVKLILIYGCNKAWTNRSLCAYDTRLSEFIQWQRYGINQNGQSERE